MNRRRRRRRRRPVDQPPVREFIIAAVFALVMLLTFSYLFGGAFEEPHPPDSTDPQALLDREIVAGTQVTTTISTSWDDIVVRDSREGAWTLSYELELRSPDSGAPFVRRQTLVASCQPALAIPETETCGADLLVLWDTSLLDLGPHVVMARMTWRNWVDDLIEYGRFVDVFGQDSEAFFLLDRFVIIETAPIYELHLPIISKVSND